MSLSISSWKKWFADHRETIFRDFFTFLKFKSIATDPVFASECLQCANWLSEYLKKIGLDVEVWKTSKQPVLFAKQCKAQGRPTLLLYHHYDVQPVDPLELWESDPFEPTLREGNIYARGAQDNKGQCFYSITAIKALMELCDSLNFNLKVFIEGEEESGSRGTEEVFQTKKKDLESDYLLAVDVSMPAPGVPAITLGIRGILTMEILCRESNRDMHSGDLGGIAYNPIRSLVEGLSKFWDAQGKVAIPHFYEDVKILSKEELAQFDLEINEERVKKEFGLRSVCPEPGFSLGESGTIRPTVEINGIQGGYTGEGFKTVIPAIAKAKVSCRLVPDQDPEKIFSHLKDFLQKQLPEGMELKIESDHGSKAFRSSKDSVIAKVAAKAYEEVLEAPCKNILCGGSIPIVAKLSEVSGAQTVMMGYGLDSDQIHAPNERFGVDRFELGFLTMGRIFGKLHGQS